MNQLGPDQRLLWDGLAAGVKLHAVAEELDISYDQAKRRRRKLLKHLVAQLHDVWPET